MITTKEEHLQDRIDRPNYWKFRDALTAIKDHHTQQTIELCELKGHRKGRTKLMECSCYEGMYELFSNAGSLWEFVDVREQTKEPYEPHMKEDGE